MARVKLSEYKAKRLLVGDTYDGVQLKSGEEIALPEGEWVVKVDQGVKKRFKQGLITVRPSAQELKEKIASWEAKGFSQFIAEPFRAYDQKHEQYLSLERTREGIRMLHAAEGGVDIESNPEKVLSYTIESESDLVSIAEKSKLPESFLLHLYKIFDDNFFTFLEINPLVVHDGKVILVDAALLVDSAGEFFVRGAWSEDDIVKSRAKHQAESHVEALAATTPASLKLSVINPDGALFFLLSGGGGSIVIVDEAQLQGVGSLIGNYGEYSGGPSREETYLYAKEVIRLCLDSSQTKKALVIAGGVANFTDVRQTFLGIIDALTEVAEEAREKHVLVFVRRGGPNEHAGLALMREFLERERLLGGVHGSDAIITKAVEEAIHYVQS